jgi:hypothetical protein
MDLQTFCHHSDLRRFHSRRALAILIADMMASTVIIFLAITAFCIVIGIVSLIIVIFRRIVIEVIISIMTEFFSQVR